ncbi:hypothetical protein IFM89_011951 [Coptis chinensis]|uniref:RanBP2-type domain-containing protein n=1 Tax=Coptis chinensis TaxID=261450 RepID=A0A835H5R9_9MAGN|nr:hypothetical protein IFM89_011951 [Coptis chinensis]
MGEGREGDWECGSCTNRNYAFRSFCNHCKQPRILVDNKTPADSKWLPRIGDWICSAKRTYRRDPLDNFKALIGGWNIGELHYWVCWMHRFCTTGVNFMGEPGDTLKYIVKQSNVTVDNLRNVSDYLSAAKACWSGSLFLGSRCPDKALIVVGDTCVAMDQWVQNPTSHTALDDILPCVDNTTANETLLRSKQGLLFITISLVLSVPILCNPFHADLTDRSCASGEVEFSNATQVRAKLCLSRFHHRDVIRRLGHLTPDYYDPDGWSLLMIIALKVKRYSKWIYTGLVMVSAAVMLSLIFWVIYARERRHRVYTKHLMRGYGQGPSEENKGM